MKASQARDMAIAGRGDLKDVLADITDRAGDGYLTLTYYGDIGDAEVKTLRELGYTIHWNGACLWWEVSW